jgi:hypothetical protein
MNVITASQLDERAAKREQALWEIREAGEAEGISPKLIAEGETSMRSAFAMNDAMDLIFGAMFGGRK